MMSTMSFSLVLGMDISQQCVPAILKWHSRFYCDQPMHYCNKSIQQMENQNWEKSQVIFR